METQQVQQQEANSIHRDILEAVLSHVPLTDLVLASHVSNSWNVAVSSSLRFYNHPKPWLLYQTQNSRPPYSTTTHAYDPRSDVWIHFDKPSIKYVNVLRSSHSDLLYMLSPWSFSFSIDSLHLTWHHAPPPVVWRTDPIVAVVGRRVVISGGACALEDDLHAVEIYDIDSGAWSTCDFMPSLLIDSAASTWLSVAVNDTKLFVTEKHSGTTLSFDPITLTWFGPYEIRPDPNIFYSVIGYSNNRLIMTSLLGQPENVVALKIHEIDTKSFSCSLIGEMPVNLLEKMKREVFEISSIGTCVAGDYVYIYNPGEIGEVFVCEVVDGGCEWRSVRNAVVDDRRKMERCVYSCCEVSVDNLRRAMRLENWKFRVAELE
ncbi:F-box/kelch-repeat protein At1g23390 [Apium graveolens]|uniref:F-box/kelch-repeat protein At1g23390 n=1 Tax=Apium graveolens TaxID=4045 RepID=UPI003D79B13D